MDQKKVWDEISSSWNENKKEPFSDIKPFLKKLSKKKVKILDLGCGSGRNFIKTKGTLYGTDFSKNMLKYAKKNAKKKKIKVKLKKMENNKIPFKSNFFDAVICIALLHCMKKTDQNKILKELLRVMKSKSKAFISVWNKNSPRLKNKPKTSYIPWTVKGKKYLRYTYIYDEKELKKQLEKIGFKIIKSEKNKNLNVIIKKP